jgi:hypothetical protein
MSIDLQWDNLGHISLNPIAHIALTDYDRDDGVAASVPMLVSGQLGVLRPNYALALCDRLLGLLETDQYAVEPVNSVLKKATIKLYHRGDKLCRVYLTFHPKIGFMSNEDSVEEGVRQLLYNYAGCVLAQLASEFGGQIRAYLLLSLLYYLDHILIKEVTSRSFDPARPSSVIQTATNQFARELYSHWEEGYYPEETISEMQRQARASHYNLHRLLTSRAQPA